MIRQALVLDANILIRAVLGRRVFTLLNQYQFTIIKSSLFVLLLLAGAAWYVVNFTWAESRVRDLCRQIHPGKEFGIVFMGEQKANGRYSCKIFLEAAVVKTAEYNTGQ